MRTLTRLWTIPATRALVALLFVLLLVRSLVALVARPHRQTLPRWYPDVAPGPRRRPQSALTPARGDP